MKWTQGGPRVETHDGARGRVRGEVQAGVRAARPGVALVVVVLVMAAIAAMTTGLLFAAVQESRIATAMDGALRARLAAESAVRATLARWAELRADTFPVGERLGPMPEAAAAPDGALVAVTIERLGPSFLLVDAEARTVDGARARAVAPVRIIDAAELWRGFPAAFQAGAVPALGANVQIEGTEDAFGAAAACGTAELQLLRRALGTGPREAILPGPNDAPGAHPVPAFRLGPIDPARLEELADLVAVGSLDFGGAGLGLGTGSPRDGGRAGSHSVCGSTGEPSCVPDYPLIYAPGDLLLRGGRGRGILVVDGALTLDDGVVFDGPVLLTGRLHLRGGAAILGAVTQAAAATPALAGEGSIRYDVCAIARALLGSTLTHRAYALPGRRWIPMRWTGGK